MRTFFALLSLALLPVTASAAPILFLQLNTLVTVPAGVDVLIPAVIINGGSESIEFGCAKVPCGGPSFGVTIISGFGEGLNALQPELLDASGTSFIEQFVGLTLAPGGSFNFSFVRINFDPTIPVGNPLGNILHPTFGFFFEGYRADVPITISTGDALFFGGNVTVPLTTSSSPVPEPPSLVLMAIGLIGSIALATSKAADDRIKQ